MNGLELKVPPPLVALVLALAMWAVSWLTFALEVDVSLRIAMAAAIGLVGLAFSTSGIAAFRQARTTLNPMKPEAASTLVTNGIYRFTRNPMYVGLLLVLVGWAAFLCAPWALVGPAVFVLYMNRFQIAPEERVLRSAFGEGYAAYQAKVRRWL
ncbi:isoprenylcysteine carboxylmethyltransferase family protein [Variovorax sp. YR216]|uniref:methyltransferase family protein n=1 Tax=Variovorax sp. YR216 TaxID=1882828 RepID=UPI0008971044|nr:isoprenylcysteine carboxylmethyltransferase family protein [Variovorax sp. YR216]SEB10187.1 Protein-S-isoprenylcysteine O-methyltransferase Ste14 [Variovorax sp. YR216]